MMNFNLYFDWYIVLYISFVLFLCESIGVFLLIYVSFIFLCIYVSDYRFVVDWFNVFTFFIVEFVSGEFVILLIILLGFIVF